MSAVVTRVGRPGWVAWLIALGIALAALNLRTAVTSVGPVLDQVTSGLGMSAVTTGVLTTLPVLCFAVFGAMTPALSRRMGEHRLLLVALVLLGAGLVLRSLVSTAVVFLAASVVALAGGAIGNVVIPTLIKRHFPRRAGAMTTVYSTALAAGTMVAAAATVPIQRAADGNWHVALGVWAALAAVAAIPWLALSRSEPERRTTLAATGPGALARTKLAWAIAGYFGTQSLIAYVMFGWLPLLLRDNGFTSGEAGMVLAVFTGLGVPISMVVPALSTRLRDQRPLVVAFAALYVAGFAGLLTGHALWVWSLVVAVGMGSFPLALSLLALRTQTAAATAGLSAFGQSTGYLIAGAGPLAFGVLHQVSGGWALPFGLLFAVVAAQAVTGWYAGADRALEDEVDGERPGRGVSWRRRRSTRSTTPGPTSRPTGEASAVSLSLTASRWPLQTGDSGADLGAGHDLQPTTEGGGMSSIEHSVDVNVPIRTAYNQWTQFESFPQFMEGVESVKQLDDTRTEWVAEIAGVRREFEAEITEQHPDERVAWRSLDQPRQAGVVTFHRLGNDTTRVTLQMEYDPEGVLEKAADALQIVRFRVRGDLERFKVFIESRGSETGAWRGEVPGPHQQGGTSTGRTGSGTGYDIGEPMPPQPVNPEYPRDTPLPPPGPGPIPPAPGTGPASPGTGPVPPRDTPGPVF